MNLDNLNNVEEKDLSQCSDNYIKYYETYGGTGDIMNGEPMYTSVELYSVKNGEETVWVKKSTHRYSSINPFTHRHNRNNQPIILVEEIENGEEIFNEINSMDLSMYFTSYVVKDGIARYCGIWGVEYNHDTKIEGSSFIEIDEVERIKALLSFEQKEKELMMHVMNKLETQNDKNMYGLRFGLLDMNLSDTSTKESLQQSGKVHVKKIK